MSTGIEKSLQRWLGADLLDTVTAERIRAFESERSAAARRRWPTLLAWAFGALMLGAGVLLFVAAHWDELSPVFRFLTVLLLVAAFHLLAVIFEYRHRHLATALHAAGTASLGAGIYLAGQIFHLQEYWPGALMLWSVGAAAAWLLRPEWVQATMTALLVPSWLAGEWDVAAEPYGHQERLMLQGLSLLAITYLSSEATSRTNSTRRALRIVGSVALLPLTVLVASSFTPWNTGTAPTALMTVGYLIAFGVPSALAFFLRGRAAWWNLAAALWVFLLGLAAEQEATNTFMEWLWTSLGVYAVCAIGSVFLIYWGLREARPERVNLGIVGFGLTVGTFYFSNVMDKLGRSVSLIGLGALFLVGGWLLERTRRRILDQMARGAGA